MKSPKIFFLLIIFFSFLISIFGSLVVFNFYLPNIDNKNSSIESSNSKSSQIKIQGFKDLESNVKTVVKAINPAVVSIIISKDVQIYKTDPFGFFYEPSGTVKSKIGGGSGFFVTKDGLILTNKHVVEDPNASYTIITSNGEEYIGKIAVLDPSTDLAIIKAYTKEDKELDNFPIIDFTTDKKTIEVGNFVIAIGNALAEFQNTVTFGIVSGIGRNIKASDQTGNSSELLSGLIQTDAPINPGNSGGPLVNLDGKVVGINTAIASGANGLGFAIPLSQKDVDHIIKSVKNFGKIIRPFLGIKYFPIDSNIAKSLSLKSTYGDCISTDTGSILSGSPAEKAGLRPGDILLEVDGKLLKDGYTIKDVISSKFPGDKISLKVLRLDSGNTENLSIVLGQM